MFGVFLLIGLWYEFDNRPGIDKKKIINNGSTI